ncbi:MAG: hypothetical protein R3Y11_01765 [Pseudomonadota bacterium]
MKHLDKRLYMLPITEGLHNAHDILGGIYDTIKKEKTLLRLFYDEEAYTRSKFIHNILRPNSWPFVIFWEGVAVGFAWLNTPEGRSARGHAVLFSRAWGRKTSSAICRACFTHLIHLQDEQGYLFDVLLGLTPTSNTLAVALSKASGAEVVGVIPHGIYIEKEGHTVDGMLFSVTREGLARSATQEQEREV